MLKDLFHLKPFHLKHPKTITFRIPLLWNISSKSLVSRWDIVHQPEFGRIPDATPFTLGWRWWLLLGSTKTPEHLGAARLPFAAGALEPSATVHLSKEKKCNCQSVSPSQLRKSRDYLDLHQYHHTLRKKNKDTFLKDDVFNSPSPPKAPFSQALMVLVKLMTSALWAKSGINDLPASRHKRSGRRFSVCSQMQWLVLSRIHGFFARHCWNAGSRGHQSPFAHRKKPFTSKAAPVREGDKMDKDVCCAQALLPANVCANRISCSVFEVWLARSWSILKICEVIYPTVGGKINFIRFKDSHLKLYVCSLETARTQLLPTEMPWSKHQSFTEQCGFCMFGAQITFATMQGPSPSKSI